MKSSSELIAAYEAQKSEIYNEIRFTMQFSLSHHFLLCTSIEDLPPQFDQLRKQMIEAFWAMIYLRLLLVFDNDGICSLLRFIRLSYDMKVIDTQVRDDLINQFEQLKASDEIKKAETIRSKIIAHSDRKKPEDTKMTILPILQSIEEIFVTAGGQTLDTHDLEDKLGAAWSSLFDLLRMGVELLPKDWQTHVPPSSSQKPPKDF